jgi:hypothetical protein
LLRRPALVVFITFAALLGAAPAAFATTGTDVEIVADGAGANNTGPPNFTPTGANSKVEADDIAARLDAGHDVTISTATDFNQDGKITVSAPITATDPDAGELFLTADDGTSNAPGFVGVTQTAPIVVGELRVQTTSNDNAELTNAANDFDTFSAPGIVSSLDLVDADGVNLGQTDPNSSSSITAGGNITQTGRLFVGGALTVSAGGANDITLNNSGNEATFLEIDSGDDVSYVDSISGLQLADVDVQGDLTVTANGNGNLGQSAGDAVNVGGTFTASAPGDNVTLNGGSNNFSTAAVTSANNASLTDMNALVLGTSSPTGNLNLNTSGALTQAVGSSATVPGTTTIDTNNSDVTLGSGTNNFGTVAIPDANDATVTDANALSLGANTLTGVLTVNTSGNLTQTGAISTTSNVQVDAGTGDVTLTNPANQVNSFSVNADDATWSEANNVLLGVVNADDLSVTAAGDITQVGAPLAVGGTATLDADANITLNISTNMLTNVSIPDAHNASVVDTNGLTLGTVDVSGDLRVQTSLGLTQTAPATVAGTTRVQGSPATIDQAANDFVGAMTFLSGAGGPGVVRDANDLVLDSSTSTTNSLTASAGDDLSVLPNETISASGELLLVADAQNPAAPAIGTGGIEVGANSALTGNGAVRLYGSRRADNTIAGTATFNGSTFSAGPLFAPSAREQWGVYSPAGTATAPFTFFYKDADTIKPQAQVTSPANGATYQQGEVVNAAYSCSDDGGGSGVASCVGTVANSAAINTSTAGQKTFTVEATDKAGNQDTKSVTYTVAEAPADPPPEDPPTGPTVTELLTGDCRQLGAGAAAAQPIVGSPLGGVLLGTEGQDMIVGDRGPDQIGALGGPDCLRGWEGPDSIDAGTGRDVVYGGPGRDRLDSSSPERDFLRCGKARDRAIVSANDETSGCESVKVA